ncbi:MAG: outer membrane lipoprotein-sorting protein, partial [Pseudomonadales bacterium]|nr:outer membrane lipoprotein-sorting protein [Pseudomonadales bacterium]
FAAEYWDPKGQPLKTLAAEDIRLVDGIWTRHKLTIKNIKTGHSTVFQVREVDYQTPVLDQVFTKRAMKKGF